MTAQLLAASSAWVRHLARFARCKVPGSRCQMVWLRRAFRCHMLAITVLLGTACGPAALSPAVTPSRAPLGSCTLALAADTADESAIRATLAAEGEQVVAQEILPLMALWAEDSYIADAKNTPNVDDDQRWIEKDAIRHRYVRTVFPGAPSAIQPADLAITIDGDRATVVATTNIGDEVAPAGDRWELVKHDGCWYIQSLTYNLEARE